MGRLGANNDGDGLVARLKETADGLGQLIADHVKLARVELVSDARAYGRGLAVVAVAAILLVVGYVFAWAAGALALAAVVGAPISFGAVAAFHLILGAVAIASALRKMRRTEFLRDSETEAARSVSTLVHPLASKRLDGNIAHEYQQSR